MHAVSKPTGIMCTPTKTVLVTVELSIAERNFIIVKNGRFNPDE